MKLIELKSHDPYLNLAIEEYIFQNADEETFILWQNAPCIVIGKNQNPYAEINIGRASERGVNIVRRITGGGAVYHDLGNVNYSFIAPSHKEGIDFAYFTAPIIKALGSLGVNCNLSGRNDLVLSDGKKISGNAQHSSSGRVLHHGTLLFNSDLDVLDSLLCVDAEKLKSKAVRSARARVANICEYVDKEIDVSEFISNIKSFVLAEYSAKITSEPIADKILSLAERNRSKEWIFNEKDYLSIYNIKGKKRFEFGSVELNITLNKDVIYDIRFYGDFFEKMPVCDLEEKMRGISLGSPEFMSIDPSEYILGMTKADLYELLECYEQPKSSLSIGEVKK